MGISPFEKTPVSGRRPIYVDNKHLSFTHDQTDLQFTFMSDWGEVEGCMSKKHTNICALYFPPTIVLQYNNDVEARLAYDLRMWSFFNRLGPKFVQLGLD